MARVCIACGLKADDQGRLYVNVGDSAWPYGCAETNGAPVYCGSDGVLRVAPEKFRIRTDQRTSFRTGQVTSATFGSPTIGGADKNFDSPLIHLLENPSDCLPMQVAVRYGVHHAALTKVGAGNSQVLYGMKLTITGGIVDTNEAHQQWRHDGSVSAIVFDTQNGTEVNLYTLAPGASATISAQPYINVPSYNGNTTLTNFSGVLDIDAWNP